MKISIRARYSTRFEQAVRNTWSYHVAIFIVKKLEIIEWSFIKSLKSRWSIEILHQVTLINLLNRELFVFPSVRAFPKDSKIGLDARIFLEIFPSVESHKKSTIDLVDSVFPEPVIPEINMDCDWLYSFTERKALFAVKKFINYNKYHECCVCAYMMCVCAALCDMFVYSSERKFLVAVKRFYGIEKC